MRPRYLSLSLIRTADVRTSSALHDKDSQSALRDAQVSVQLRAWRHVGAAGGLIVVAAGLVAVARGRAWAGMGRRFDAPTTGAVPEPRVEQPPIVKKCFDPPSNRPDLSSIFSPQ